ncbi:MAG: alpha/beta hydrolase [Kiritimatiellae bacterium]|nr:alpha/beta hydrolase [Kiritimatiellia bacterium]
MPDDVEHLPDIVFGTGGGRDLKLDIVRPRPLPAKPMPVIVWVHGGAWRKGSKDGSVGRLTPFAQAGYCGVSIEYRLSQEAIFPAQIHDCKCAVRFLRAHAQTYRIDPNRIGAWGSSAGGHLVALLGTSGGVAELEGNGGWPDFSSRVQAVCNWFGPSDFLRMDDGGHGMRHNAPDSPESQLIGGPIQENKDKVAKANPMTYIDSGDPPFLTMHGELDKTVILNQGELLHAALQKAGVESTLYVVKGGGHGFKDAEQPHHELVGMVRAFFDKYLK